MSAYNPTSFATIQVNETTSQLPTTETQSFYGNIDTSNIPIRENTLDEPVSETIVSC